MRGRASTVALLAASVLAGCGGGEPRLTVERFESPVTGPEVLVSVSPEVNQPDTTGGEAQVEMVCTDRRQREVIRSVQPWPFEADGVGNDLPHAHQQASDQLVAQVARCRLLGTDPPLSGDMSLAR